MTPTPGRLPTLGRVALRSGSVLIVCAITIAWCLLPGTAWATSTITVEINGTGFTSTPAGPLLNTRSLAPGSARSGTIGVRNDGAAAALVHLRLTNLRDDENGCTRPESAVDSSCGSPGAGAGELSGSLEWSVGVSSGSSGPFALVWQGSTADLVAGAHVGRGIPAHQERHFQVGVRMPMSAGNDVQTDSITFGVVVTVAAADGNGADAGSIEVLGNQAGIAAGAAHPGPDSGPAAPAAFAVEPAERPLALSGAPILMYLGAGLLLLCSGLLMVSASRPRRTG